MGNQTPLQASIEDALGQPLEAFAADRRPAVSWRRIALEITQRTGIDVTGEALRVWTLYRRDAA